MTPMMTPARKYPTLPCSRCSRPGEPHTHNADRTCSTEGCACGKPTSTTGWQRWNAKVKARRTFRGSGVEESDVVEAKPE